MGDSDIVIYDGRAIPERGFRAYVYGLNNAKKLANSWLEYQALISSGIWVSKKSELTRIAKNIEKESDKDSKKGK